MRGPSSWRRATSAANISRTPRSQAGGGSQAGGVIWLVGSGGGGPGAVAMFESLQSRFATIVRNLTGRGVLSEADVDAALREVRLALLGADVHFKVANAFVDRVRAAAGGALIPKS